MGNSEGRGGCGVLAITQSRREASWLPDGKLFGKADFLEFVVAKNPAQAFCISLGTGIPASFNPSTRQISASRVYNKISSVAELSKRNQSLFFNRCH